LKSFEPQFDEIIDESSLSSSSKHCVERMKRGLVAGTEDVVVAATAA
jgi:hypothetical protein